MRISLAALSLLAAMTLSACGGTTDKTVVVTPKPTSTVVVPSNDGKTTVVVPPSDEKTTVVVPKN